MSLRRAAMRAFLGIGAAFYALGVLCKTLGAPLDIWSPCEAIAASMWVMRWGFSLVTLTPDAANDAANQHPEGSDRA